MAEGSLRPKLFFLSSEDRAAGSRASATFSLTSARQDWARFKPVKFQITNLLSPRNDAVLSVRTINPGATPPVYGSVLGGSYNMAPNGGVYFVDYANPGGTNTKGLAGGQLNSSTAAQYPNSMGGQTVQTGSTNWVWGAWQPPSVGAYTQYSADQLTGSELLRSGYVSAPPAPANTYNDGTSTVVFSKSTVGQPVPAVPGGNGPMPFQWQMARIFESAVNDVLWKNNLVTVVTTNGDGYNDGGGTSQVGWPLYTPRVPFLCVEPGGVAFCNVPATTGCTGTDAGTPGTPAGNTTTDSSFVNNSLGYAFGWGVPCQYLAYLDTNASPPAVTVFGNPRYYTLSAPSIQFSVSTPDVAAIFGIKANTWYTILGMSNVAQQRAINNGSGGGSSFPPLNQYFNMGYGSTDCVPYGPPNFSVHMDLVIASTQSETSDQRTYSTVFQVPINVAPGNEIEFASDTIDWNLNVYEDRISTLKVWLVDYWGQPMNDETTDPHLAIDTINTDINGATLPGGAGLLRGPYQPYQPVQNQNGILTPDNPAYSSYESKTGVLWRTGAQYPAVLPPWKMELGIETDNARLPGVKRGRM